MAKRLEYEISTDASKGISGLKQFSAAAKKELKGVSDAVDDTASNAEKVSKVFSDMAGKIESEMKQAASAAEALGKALGPEVAGRADLDSIVADLNRMGLSFDEITADADKLATGLKELDRVGQSGIGANLPASTRRAKAGLDDVRNSADQSRSVLANMVGNSAQDLGALSGVAGSAGVALGQLAEYAADGNIRLSSLVSTIAPLAALGVAVAGIAGEMQDVAKIDAFNKAKVEGYTKAIRDGASATGALVEQITEAGKVEFAFGDAVFDALPLISQAGLTLEQYAILAASSEANIRSWAETHIAAGGDVENTKLIVHALLEDMEALNEAELTATSTNQFFAKSIIDLNKELRDAEGPLRRYPQYWEQIINDLRDGRIDSQATAGAINLIASELGLTTDQVIALARQELDRQLADIRDRAGEAAENTLEFAEALQEAVIAAADAQLEINDMASTFSEMARRDTAIQAAFDLGDAAFNVEKNASDINVALEDLAAFVREHGPPISDGLADLTSIDFAHGEVDVAPFLQKLDALKGPIRQKIGEAFITGTEETARVTALQLIATVTDALGGALTTQQVNEMLFGPGGFEMVIKVAVDQESLAQAKAMIELLTGLPGADPRFTAQVLLDLQADKLTPEAAQVLVAQHLGERGVEVPASLLPPAGSELAAAKAEADAFYRDHPTLMPTTLGSPGNRNRVLTDEQRLLNQHPLVIPVQYKVTDRNPLRLDSGGTAGIGGGVAGERGPEILNGKYLTTGPTYVPPGTKVTSRRQTAVILRNGGTRGLKRYDQGGVVPAGPVTINFNGVGAIGNRYDMMRTIERGLRDRTRLLGSRS